MRLGCKAQGERREFSGLTRTVETTNIEMLALI